MSIACPLTNTKEWQQLVEFAGSEDRAKRIYLAYTMKTGKQEIPDAAFLEQFKEQPKSIKEDVTKHRLYPLIYKNVKEIERLNKVIARKQSDLKKSTEKPLLAKSIQKLRARIEELEQENYDIKRKDSLSEVAKYAEADLNRVRSIFDKYRRGEVQIDEISNAVKIITMWEKAGDFSQGTHLFLTDEELNDLDSLNNPIFNEILDGFRKWRGEAEILSIEYKEIALDIIKNQLQETFGDNLEVDVEKTMKDVGVLFSNTIDISEIDLQVARLMSQQIRKANWDAHRDVQDDFKEVEKVMNKLRSAKKLESFISLLQQRQSNTDNRHTGDNVSRFTQEWHNREKSIYNKLKQSLINAEEIVNKVKRRRLQQAAYKEFHKEIKKISKVIDVRKLFFDNPAYKKYAEQVDESFTGIKTDFNENDRQAYIAELKEILGEEGYNHYYTQVKNKLETYIQDEEGEKSYLESVYGEDMAAIASEMDKWTLKYNPFWNCHYNEHGHPIRKIGNNWASSSKAYISTIARKYDKNGKDNGFYDDNFEQIMSDPLMNESYRYITEVIKEYAELMPAQDLKFWQINSFPIIQKSILETFGQDGMLSGLNSTWESLKESTQTEVYNKLIPSDINDKELQLGFSTNNNSTIFEYITRKTIAYKQKHPNVTNEELELLRDEWKKDKQDELASQKSWDIEKVLKAFMYHTATFKHKSKIEDAFKIYRTYIDEIVDQQNRANDNPNSNVSRKLGAKTDDLSNLKKQIDFTLNKFFGYSVRKKEKIKTKESRKRIYTKEEKKIKEELDNSLAKTIEDFNNKKITEEVYTEQYNAIVSQLNNLGKVRSWNNIIDGIIKYIQLKSIGWNISSMFANIGFGQIANWIEAAGGQRFNQKELIEATAIMSHSVLKNFSFNKVETDLARRIRGSMEYLDVLKESKNEIFEQKRYNNAKKFKWLSPFNGQSRGEYINQGQVMIAMLKHNKCLVDGKEMNLWDAQNAQGRYDDNVKPPKDSGFDTFDQYIFDIKSKIDDGIRHLHGNYDYDNAPLKAKETVLGRAVSQFRTWAFGTFYDRFGRADRTINPIAGYQKKGRYLSYGNLYKSFGVYRGTMIICQNLLRKLAFSNTKFDELIGDEFSETDAANLRKNLQELVLIMVVTGLGLLGRALKDDDDDKEPIPLYLVTFWINQMSRLRTDLLFYTNPMQFDKMQRNFIPLSTVITDTGKLMDHGIKLLLGQTTDIYPSGSHFGERKSTRYFSKVVPGWIQYTNLKSNIEQVRN